MNSLERPDFGLVDIGNTATDVERNVDTSATGTFALTDTELGFLANDGAGGQTHIGLLDNTGGAIQVVGDSGDLSNDTAELWLHSGGSVTRTHVNNEILLNDGGLAVIAGGNGVDGTVTLSTQVATIAVSAFGDPQGGTPVLNDDPLSIQETVGGAGITIGTLTANAFGSLIIDVTAGCWELEHRKTSTPVHHTRLLQGLHYLLHLQPGANLAH